MHRNQHKTWSILLLCLTALVFSFNLHASDAKEVKIENFKVEDIPGDRGNGLILKWKPLSDDLRIMEYRVYRGTTKDALYYLGTVALNPDVGFKGDTLTFSDQGWKPFVDKTCPGSRVVDKNVESTEATFYGTMQKGYPRDLDILAQENGKLQFLTQIDRGIYYSKGKMVQEDSTTVLSSYPIGNVSVLAQIIPDSTYYYSVVPVNENRRYYSPSEIVSGSPIANPYFRPAKDFYGALITDEDTNEKTLNFEWDYHSDSSLPLTKIYLFDAYWDDVATDIKYKDQAKRIPYSNSYNTLFTPIVLPITSSENRQSYKLEQIEDNYCFMTGNDTIIIDVDNIEKYTVAIVGTLQGEDYLYYLEENENLNSGINYKEIVRYTTADLPQVKEVTVSDKPNDKGDTQVLVWEKPTIEITKTNFSNKLGSYLIVNYEYYESEAEKIKSVNFDFMYDDNDEVIMSYNEFYLNNIIKMSLPEEYDNHNLIVKMTITTNNKETEPYSIIQYLNYDEIMKSLNPGDIFKDGLNLRDFTYDIYAKSQRPNFGLIKTRTPGKTNNYPDVISYEDKITTLVHRFDVETKGILITSDLTVFYDTQSEMSLELSPFSEIAQGQMDKQLAQLEEQAETNEKAQLFKTNIMYIKEFLDTNPSDSKWMSFVKKQRDKSLRYRAYKMVATNSKGLFVDYKLPQDEQGNDIYFMPVSNDFDYTKWPMLLATIIFGLLVAVMVSMAKRGKDLYIRPIAGIQEIDNAIGRATEMGRPILFVPGMSSISAVATLAALSILGKVAKKAAEYDTRIIVPCKDFIVMPIAQEIVKESHIEAGRPDTYDKNSVFFITQSQFAYVAGVNGIMIREKTATNFYMGQYFAESLLMTETGNTTGAIQIAGTDSVTQIPFFITTCDYTLIGEELYAASAYMSKEPMILGTLKAQDYFKFIILFFVIVGTILSTAQVTFLLDIFPTK